MFCRARGLLAAAVALLAFGLPAPARAQERLRATVGPGFAITLNHENGTRVQNLQPGTYTITVEDRAPIHSFHLFGPGVEQQTGIEFEGTVTWTVTFQDGQTYRYRCEVHPATMRGVFTVGTPPPPPPTVGVKKLVATVGPGFTISLKFQDGGRVTRLKSGPYRIIVRDRSAIHNFHLVGPGVNKRTGVRFRGTVRWRVTFRTGKRYRFNCDPHRTTLRGTFRTF